MTLREELEILRGEPIKAFIGRPEDIPSLETSDAEKLFKHPVVSVYMVTYNHESYIRQAIDGVMMQKTDFEFELVIGEDCSTDRTREICFEYQKKYPDKIRVIWWHENVSKYGGNKRRTIAHCRGEFLAFCEGDDYWTDSLKLQKQVNLMRQYPSAGLCLTSAEILQENGKTKLPWKAPEFFSQSFMKGNLFCLYHLNGCQPSGFVGSEGFVMTASALVRKSALVVAERKFQIFRWMLRLSDSIRWLGVSANSDVCFLRDRTVVYRRTATGACASSRGGVWLDSILVRFYFMREIFGLGPEAFAGKIRGQYYQVWISRKNLIVGQLRKQMGSIKLFRGVYAGLIGILFLNYTRVASNSVIFTRLLMGVLRHWPYGRGTRELCNIYKRYR